MQRTGPRVPVLWTRGPQPPAQRGVLWEMECKAAGRTGRCSPTTGRTRGPLGDGVRPQGLPQSTRKMEFPRPSNSPHLVPYLQVVKLRPVRVALRPQLLRASQARPQQSRRARQRRARRHPLSTSSEPLAFVCCASRSTQGIPFPTTPSVSLTPEAQPPACWGRGQSRCLPLAVGAGANRPGPLADWPRGPTVGI